MKASEVLRQYSAGERDFRDVNLRGQSFKGKNLAGADFSNADLSNTKIQAANFNNARFVNTKFVGAEAGFQKHSVVVLILLFWLLSELMVVVLVAFAAIFSSIMTELEHLNKLNIENILYSDTLSDIETNYCR